MPVGSTTVMWASFLSSFCRRFAARVPPTPPPRTTISAGIVVSPGLPDDEPAVPVLREHFDQLVPGLLDPRVDADLANQLRLLEEIGPVLLPALREPGHGRGAFDPSLRGHPVVLSDRVLAERLHRPVLKEHVHLSTHGGSTDREHGGGAQLVVGAGEQHQGKRFVHATLLPRWIERGSARPGRWGSEGP